MKTTATFKRAGVMAPLFSVYSKQSIGIGDFSDLRLLIDWAKRTGNSIIQLLPMNEAGPLFCPYDSLSSFALEPMYISLADIPEAQNKNIKAKIKDLRRIFPAGREKLNYAIKKEKLELLWEIFVQYGNADLPELKKFKEDNAYWLSDFCLYKVIKAYYSGRPWYEWDDKFKNRDAGALDDFKAAHRQEFDFEAWLQWRLYEQFKQVKACAEANKVLVKGDLPILVSRDSADVWAHSEFFKLDFAAGAPPDLYCAKGQRWGMPTYNWDNIKAGGFVYLKEKLKFAQNFYSLLRIDHVVGLFRIWSIPVIEPLENKGLNGFFDPQDESRWQGQGQGILSVILNSTDMLICAEDLGIIPRVCTETLKNFHILGNDVQRWAKDWGQRHDFLQPQEYRELSVAMLSTHDTTNFPAWWENEAGTVDEELFIRKCEDARRISFLDIKDKLFDLTRSCHARLRWQDSVDSIDRLAAILGKNRQEIGDFIDLYENTYHEKEKLWKHFGLSGPMREKSDPEIARSALKITLESSAIFCINTVIDLLCLADIFQGNPYQYRINTPGTVSDKNWSLTIPIPLDELLRHRVNKEIRKLVKSSGRV